MTIEEAIKILTQGVKDRNLPANPDFKDSMKLGIEALKWRRQMELDYGSWCGPPLPGETEE